MSLKISIHKSQYRLFFFFNFEISVSIHITHDLFGRHRV